MSVPFATESSNGPFSSSSVTGLTSTSGRYFLFQFVPTIDTCKPVSHSIVVSTPPREAWTRHLFPTIFAVYQWVVLLSWTVLLYLFSRTMQNYNFAGVGCNISHSATWCPVFFAAALVTVNTPSIRIGLLKFPTSSVIWSLRLWSVFLVWLFTHSTWLILRSLLKACDVSGEVLDSLTYGFVTLVNLFHQCITFVCLSIFVWFGHMFIFLTFLIVFSLGVVDNLFLLSISRDFICHFRIL